MDIKYNTFLFDMDGTLLNTLEDLTDSVNYALETCGYPKRTMDEVRSFLGNGVKVLISKSVPANTSDTDMMHCLAIYQKHYSENMESKTRPYDGINELLQVLKEKGIKLAIVSNKFDSAVKALCREYFQGYIDIAIGESENVARKPAPDGVFTALNQLSSKKEEALYVGDSEVDVKTAHNAGLKCVGVTWGFRDREILKAEGADFIIDNPLELLDFIS